MRRKKTDYTGHYSPVRKYSTLLSQNSGKHSSKVRSHIDTELLDEFSRYHTRKDAQYQLKYDDGYLVITISQAGDIAFKQISATIGTIASNGQFKLFGSFAIGNARQQTIYDLCEFIGMDAQLLIEHCQKFAQKQSIDDQPKEIYKPEYKAINGPQWKLKIRK